MFFGGPWFVGLLNDNYPDLKGKWAVAPVPADKTSSSMAGGSSLAISADSPHKAAAEDFITYLTDAKGQADWYGRTKDLPANTQAWKTGQLAGDAAMEVFRKQMETAEALPAQPRLTEITSKVDDAIGAVAQGKSSAKAALDKAQSTIQNLAG